MRGFATSPKDQTTGVIDKVKQTAQNMMSMAKDAVGLGEEPLQNASNKAKDFVDSAAKTAANKEASHTPSVGEITSKAAEAVKEMAKKAKEKMPTAAQLADKVMDTVGDVANKAKKVMGSMPPVEELQENLANKAEGAKEQVKKGYNEMADKVQKAMPSKKDIKNEAQNLANKAKEAASSTIEGAKDMAKGAASAAKDMAEKESVAKTAKSAEKKMDTISSKVDKAKDMAKSAAEGAKKVTEDIAQDIKSGVRPDTLRSEGQSGEADVQQYQHTKKDEKGTHA